MVCLTDYGLKERDAPEPVTLTHATETGWLRPVGGTEVASHGGSLAIEISFDSERCIVLDSWY